MTNQFMAKNCIHAGQINPTAADNLCKNWDGKDNALAAPCPLPENEDWQKCPYLVKTKRREPLGTNGGEYIPDKKPVITEQNPAEAAPEIKTKYKIMEPEKPVEYKMF